MIKRERLIILVIALIAIQPFTMIGSVPSETNAQSSQILKIDPFQTSPIFTADGAGGEDEIKTAINENGGFEEVNTQGIPLGYNGYTSTYVNINASYQDLVHGGSYSYLVRTKGTAQTNGVAQGYRQLATNPNANLDEKIYLNTWVYCVSNPDGVFGGSLQFRVRVTSGASNWYLCYVLSAGYMPSNSTSFKYIDARVSHGSWHNLFRNITQDFEEAFQSVQSHHRAYFVYARAYSPVGATDYAEMVIDDVRVYNGSSYEFCTPNGDFESSGGGWYEYNQGPGFIYQSDDHTEGNYAINLTAYTPYSGIDPNAQLEHNMNQGGNPTVGYYATSPGNLVFECDWKYSDTSGGGSNQYAYIYFQANNGTHAAYFYIYFGIQGDVMPNWNSTDSSQITRVYAANGFGTRDTWYHMSYDPYEVLADTGFTNMAFTYDNFVVGSGGIKGNIVSLLVDNYTITSYPMGDPGFEEDWYYSTSNPIVSWLGDSNHLYANLTTDAHSGNYAANLTAYSASNDYIFRQTWLPVKSNLYTDFWWKLDSMDGVYTAGAYIEIDLEGSKYLNYILGGSSSFGPANSSSSAYYFVENFNTTGVWHNLARNIQTDLIAVFGNDNYNITSIQLRTVANGVYPTIVLFDDMHFVYDTTAPEITDVELWNTPNYNEGGIILINTTDALSDVDEVIVYYRNASTWYSVSAPLYTGEDIYRAILPKGDYDTAYEYYVEVNDTLGYVSIDDNSGLYYSYTITDLINPDIEITAPADTATISGTVEVTVDCDDRDIEGSGIDYVEYHDGLTLITTVDTAPYSFDWDTRTVTNGAHVLQATAYDIEGNSWLHSIGVTTDNDFDAPVLTNLHLNPTVPVAGSPFEIRVEATDASEFSYISLFYRIDGGTWLELPMVVDAGNYSITMSGVSAPALVEYYIQAADIYDQVSNLGTAANPYSLEFEEPTPTTTNAGTLSIGIIGIIGTIFIVLKTNKRRK